MAEVSEVSTSTPTELLGVGRRHLAVGDYGSATEALARACEMLAKEHGDTADQCAEAYLWYGKALLGLSRAESGVLGDGMPGAGNADDEEEEEEENGENGHGEQNGGAEVGEASSNGVEKSEAESTTKDEEPGSSSTADDAEPGTSNGDGNEESAMNLDNEDDVDNLQLAWEMLELSRGILLRRVGAAGAGSSAGAGSAAGAGEAVGAGEAGSAAGEAGSAAGEAGSAAGEAGSAAGEAGSAARALLADVHLALGEVALESETYDKAVFDMQNCLEIQKELYDSDDRRIAETHYQIGLANSLASSFEDAITHFKNAANILETRIKTLESPAAASEDATVKKFSTADPFYSVECEIKELKDLLPEIQEKIQDMMDYKAETIKRVRESLFPSNGEGSSLDRAGPSSSQPKPAASDISHLIKRKRKSSEGDADSSAPKRVNT